MKFKNKKTIKIISFLVVIFALIIFISTSIFNFTTKNNIDYILETKSYSYLPLEAKEYIKLVYEQTGEILKTEKNKEENTPYLNPEYIEYLVNVNSLDDTDSESNYEVIPEEMITDYIYTTTSEDIIPSSYDLRNVDGKNFVTPTKDQDSTGLCWSFATIAQAESHLLVKNDISYENGISQLFSEMQIDYATASNGIIDSSPLYSYTRNLGDGGNFSYAISPMMDNLGLVDVSWRDFSDYDYNPLEKNKVYNFTNSKYEVLSTVDYPKLDLNTLDLTDDKNVEIRNSYLNNLKKLIMENGGAYVGTVDPTGYCSFSINGYRFMYDDGKCTSAGHAMQIIGWDDNFEYSFCSGLTNSRNYIYLEKDTSKCDKDNVVTGKGAWLIKNSWGSSYPYVYLAYDSIDSEINLITEMETKDWDNYYSYNFDNSGIVKHQNQFVTGEILNKIKIETSTQNNSYEVYVGASESDLKFYKSVTTNFPGVYTIDLINENITITDKSVVKIVTNSGYKPQKIHLYTNNQGNLTKVITEDLYYENKLTDINKYIFRISSQTFNIEENTIVDYKVLNQEREEITDNYTYSENVVFANQIFSKLEIDNTLEHGTYILQTIINGEIMSESNIVVDKNIIVTQGDGTIDSPYIINTPEQLNLIRLDRFAYYRLGQDIDLTYDTQNTNGLFYNDGKGWEPIKYSTCHKTTGQYLSCSRGFSGGFDGNNHKIKGLYINRPEEDGVGLFVNVYNENFSDLHIKNVILENPNITGKSFVGSILGVAYGTTYERLLNISNIQVIGGTVTGDDYVGGIIGVINAGSYLTIYGTNIDRHIFSNLYNSATIIANNNAGGIVGIATNIDSYGAGRSPVMISNVLNKGKIISDKNASGIIGYIETRDNNSITVKESMNTGLVLGKVCSNDVTCTFSAKSEGNLYLTNIYYTGDSEINFDNSYAVINNVLKYELDDLKENSNYSDWSNFSINWKIENFDELDRLPVLKNIDFNYTSVIDKTISIDEKISIYDLISPDIEAAKNVKYEIADSSVVTVNDNGMLTGVSSGESFIHIISYYDGYQGDIKITVSDKQKQISFNTNGGSSVEPIKGFTGDIVQEPANPIKTGYKFIGWYTDEILETKYEFSVMPESDITLYAKWERLKHTITFNANDGTNNIITQEVEYKETTSLINNSFIRDGFTFVGWNTKADGSGMSYSDSQNVTLSENLNLFAIWIEEISYIINKYSVDEFNKYIDLIDVNTTVEAFKENIKLGDDFSIEVDYKSVNGKKLLYTGGKTKIYKNNELYAEYTNIIRGDVNGNATIDIIDYIRIMKDIMDTTKLSGIYIKAADVNQNGKIDIIDYIRIMKMIMEVD